MRKFKVGDKGKSRGGTDYEVVYIDETVPEYQQLLVKMKYDAGWRIQSYRMDGTLNGGSKSSTDLLPLPDPTLPDEIFVNIYSRAGRMTVAYGYEAISAAKGQTNGAASHIAVRYVRVKD